ncbi:MAG: hypothetical protein PHI59_04120, partial [Candidatus Omnitrophica bacterium]|nr:hypothetical protein [Candidatus Omnitrophota bacterium]
VWIDVDKNGQFSEDEMITSKAELCLTHNGVDYFAHLDNNYGLSIEERGPVSVCLKAKGWFVSEKGEKFCQFVTRIYAYEGTDYLKLQHTFVYTGYPENKFHYLYKGLKLPKNETIDAVYIKIPTKINESSMLTYAADGQVQQEKLKREIDLFQSNFNSYTVKAAGSDVKSGDKLKGWIDVSDNMAGISIGIKDFWQQFPKAFHIDKVNNCVLMYLWPKEAGVLDFRTTESALGPDSVARGSAFGVAKTHDLFLYFHKGNFEEVSTSKVLDTFLLDDLVTVSPQWLSDTRAMGRLWPYDKRLNAAEEFLSRLFDWGARQIENFGWYGMVDFGDTLSWYRKEAYDKSYDNWGWHPEGRWGWFNCETTGTHTGALLQFLRTGNFKYYLFGRNLARHIMDIDTCHYNTVTNDARLKSVIPEDYSQVGSIHRHNGNHWGDRNEETSHTNVYGLALYYFITGDERTHDVIDEIGSFFLKERVTYFGHPDIAPQRSIANVLWGDVLLYEITGDERYKKAADKWAELLCYGQKDDGSWLENYNPVKNRWEGKVHMGFIMGYTLPALIEYHKLTLNKAVGNCIVKATDYVIDKEAYAAYFDASAYSYWLTGDRKYRRNIIDRVDFSLAHQNRSNDPLWSGMIYQKAYYSRVLEYLYSMPYAFEVISATGKNK